MRLQSVEPHHRTPSDGDHFGEPRSGRDLAVVQAMP